MKDRALLFILTKPAGRQVLLLQTQQGWTLPVYDGAVSDDIGFADPGPFNSWFRDRYGIEVVRRRYALDQQGSSVKSSCVFGGMVRRFARIPHHALVSARRVRSSDRLDVRAA